MSDVTPTDSVPPEPESDSPAALREAAKRGDKAVRRADQLEAENQLLRAGIDPKSDNPLTQMFARDVLARKGELDVDAIKAEAQGLGVLKSAETTPTPDAIDPGEAAQGDVRQAITGGETAIVGDDGDDHQDQHPMTKTYNDYRDRLAGGQARDVGQAQAMNDVIASADDPRMQWDGFTEDEIRTGDTSRLNQAGSRPRRIDG